MPTSNQETYDKILKTVMDQLDKGVVPWQKPWKCASCMPSNYISKKPYRGINAVLLGVMYFDSPYFLTTKQIEMLNGNVKKGEMPQQVVFWKWLKVPGPKPNTEKFVPMMRLYDVYNLTQVENIKQRKHRDGSVDPLPEDESKLLTEAQSIAACEKLIHDMPEKAVIKQGRNRACYYPNLDEIGMPYKKNFPKVEEFYSTLFHELTHWTGHESRLKRKTLTEMASFGSTNYSKEELVAEFGAAFLCGLTGIDNTTVQNSAAYIDHWKQKLQDDPSLLVKSASIAQKAVDFITKGTKPEAKEKKADKPVKEPKTKKVKTPKEKEEKSAE